MRKLIYSILALLIFTSQCFALSGGLQGGFRHNSSFKAGADNFIAQQKAGFGHLPQGLTFYKDFTKSQTNNPNSLNADYSIGSPLATFTRSGGNAAYVNEYGQVKFVTSSNLPRITYGTYSTDGWTLFDTNGELLKGIVIESAITNRATYCNSPENAIWTKTNMTANNGDSGSTAPDGAVYSPSLTATGANATFTQSYTDGTAGVYTSSIFIKRKSGTGTINLRANTGNSYTDITSYVKNYWTRVPVSSTSLTNPTFDLQIVTSGDAVYIWNPQLEKNPYMTSPIPSLTTAAARGAEVLKYNILGNRTATRETIAIGCIPLGGDFANDGVERFIIDNSVGYRRIMEKESATAGVHCYWGGGGFKADTTILEKNIKYVVSMSVTNGAQAYYLNGEQKQTDTSPSMNISTATYFYIGSRYSETLQFNGIISNIVLFNSSHTVNTVNSITRGLL